ncbi:hypothetical protein BHM03_00006237 [Ensete ventricosum]|uniref:Uncharacterized protein n=1 Tax=Ensete ventricosum TaxID=4639 RepID=A0A445MBL3_ENSVE|nr:hypothetical protein BHM03_00006237 [Ensete ventricosum]
MYRSAADWYDDCSLLGGTVDWGCFRLVIARNRSVMVDFHRRRLVTDENIKRVLNEMLMHVRSTQALQQDNGDHVWDLQSVFRSIKVNCSENTKVLKQVVEWGEEATTNPEGLNYPKAKRRSEWRWTWRSAIVP